MSHFIFWMDNCSAQNKNWVVFTAMSTYVNTESGPQSITFKYLVSGHTFMSADALHAKVEKEMRLKKNLFDYDDLKEVVSKANKTVKVVSMQTADFQMWKTGAYRTRKADRPLKIPHSSKFDSLKVLDVCTTSWIQMAMNSNMIF